MTRNPIRLTAAIIALNEARRLPALLEQLDWVDEVVVVDGGSTDDTTSVARAAGARVLSRRFDHFAAQRNYALEACRGDWVLAIDADECPTEAFADEVRRRLRSSRHAAYRVPISSRIFGQRFRFSGTQDDRPVRLVRRHSARWEGVVHESVGVSGTVGQFEHGLTHNTLEDLATFRAKMNRYTSLAADRRVAEGMHPRLRDLVVAAPRETFRRLIWKHGWLDGPRGWAFCLLSGISEYVLARRHRQLWNERMTTQAMLPTPHVGRDAMGVDA